MQFINTSAFLWALGAVCQLHRKPFDPQLVKQAYPPPHTIASLQQAVEDLGLNHGVSASLPEPGLTLPALIALVSDAVDTTTSLPAPNDEEASSSPTEASPQPLRLALLLSHSAERSLILEPGKPEPTELSPEALSAAYANFCLQFNAKPDEVVDPDNDQGPPKFGFRWFVPELLKHRRIWRDVLLASLALQLVGLATPLFTQVVIDKVVVHHTTSTLTVIAVALGVFLVFNSTMTWIRQYLVLHTGNRVDAALGSRVFDHLLGLPGRYFEHRPTGILIARIHGVESLREFITGATMTLVLDLPFLLIFVAVMFFYSWQLSLIVMGLLGAVALLSALAAPLIREQLNRQFMVGARNQAFLTEYVAGIETVKSLQMEPLVRRRYGDYLAEYLAATFATKQRYNSYSVAANGLEQIMTLSILCVGAWLVMNSSANGGGFTIGMLVAFQMFAGRVSQPLLRLVGLWQEFQQASISVKRLGDILDAPVEPISLTPRRAGQGAGRIDIEGIAFRYDQERPWLYRDLSFSLKPGKVLALMGPSGSGKSTLAKLLQGFRFPEEGRITLDGQDIRHLAANELRAHLGVVPQETVLFSGTLYDNLLMANPHATFEQIVQACKWAEIHDAIEAMPEGYQTQVGERGMGLSGGQKQRIAIARALLKQPRILIFDEATANLDAQTAEHFAKTINKLRGKATMLFIAHQLPKGLHVDEVVTLGQHGVKAAVLESGRPHGDS
ncbi:MAG TPA: peptidase domain-containing ABC transporter [Rhodocyclaceae bacterium]|nr:peptidase domain-containing ABC transporter [Rhodocyclaceae bacterium]